MTSFRKPDATWDPKIWERIWCSDIRQLITICVRVLTSINVHHSFVSHLVYSNIQQMVTGAGFEFPGKSKFYCLKTNNFYFAFRTSFVLFSLSPATTFFVTLYYVKTSTCKRSAKLFIP